ncbi:hypothetical protein EJ110_NYTH26895 [Nymphaea thermarum]|nr:hypothetical protein EJ110_NYTH26895 [Nymphaea thermarum]
MDSTTSGAIASSSISVNNKEADRIPTKAKSLRLAVWKEFSRRINKSDIQRIDFRSSLKDYNHSSSYCHVTLLDQIAYTFMKMK